jgi:hypothetical protein
MTGFSTQFFDKNWQIEIYQKQPDSFGYDCYGSNGKEGRNEGYDNTQ